MVGGMRVVRALLELLRELKFGDKINQRRCEHRASSISMGRKLIMPDIPMVPQHYSRIIPGKCLTKFPARKMQLPI